MITKILNMNGSGGCKLKKKRNKISSIESEEDFSLFFCSISNCVLQERRIGRDNIRKKLIWKGVDK